MALGTEPEAGIVASRASGPSPGRLLIKQARPDAQGLYRRSAAGLDQLDPAVHGAAFGRAVVGHRVGLAEAGGLEPAGGDAVLDEPGEHRLGAGLRQGLVVVVLAHIVGMALHLDRQAGAGGQHVAGLLQQRERLRLERGLIELEGDAVERQTAFQQ